MSTVKQLSWENFKSTVFVRGQQRVHRVTDSPHIEVFGDGILNRIGVWIEIPAGTIVPADLSKLAFITSRTLNREGRELLEIATATPSLQRQFYHFAVAVTERVIVEKRPPQDAVSLELHCFADLLEEKPLLGIERQVGLLGELMFLERLVAKTGLEALDSWVGPTGEPHDFRIEAREFEVKTTLAPHRIHTIHGTEQLVPSKGCSLYLVSILLGPPGASNGFSLGDKVAHLAGQFAAVAARMIQFTTALETCGFRDSDRAQYSRQFAVRRALGLVRIDNNFPAITRSTVQGALGPLAPRVESLQYDVNIEGLEHEEGTEAFAAVLPT
jgi:hypothetical protein